MAAPAFTRPAQSHMLVANTVQPENVMVVYRSYNTNDTAFAAAYKAARKIPDLNMMPLASAGAVGFSDTATTVSIGALISLVNVVDAACVSSHKDIKVLLFIGDWPSSFSYIALGGGTAYQGFFDAFYSPVYTQWINDAPGAYLWSNDALAAGFPYSLGDGTGLYWRDDAQHYADVNVWDFTNLGTSTYKLRPWYNPDNKSNPEFSSSRFIDNGDGTFSAIPAMRAYCCFNIPQTAALLAKWTTFSNYINTVYIQPELTNTDWGTVLLSAGSSGNPTTRHFLEEAAYESYSLTKFRWTGYTGSNERGTIVFNNTRADNNAEGYVTVQPGNASFTGNAVTDLFYWAPGNYSYLSKDFYPCSSNTQYGFKNGAICVFSQSWGALNGSAEFINPDSVTINTLVATQTDSTHQTFLYANSNLGNSQRLFDLSYNNAADGMSLAYSAGTITATGGTAGQTWTASAPAGASLTTIINNIKTAITGKAWTLWTPGVYATYVQSPALWYFINKPVAFSLGSMLEPFAYGDPHTYAMFTTLYYGGNLAEWALRVLNCSYPENCTRAQLPNNWALYGDPLYRPFKQRLAGIPVNYSVSSSQAGPIVIPRK